MDPVDPRAARSLTASLSGRWILRIAIALLRHPELIATAVRQSVRLAPAGWWRTWPPVPLPAADYLHFRSVTAYGDPDREPDTADVITWLRWSRAWPKATERGRH